ncbi:MAG: metallophosphoesterase [Promethearchaeota archaeon]
MKVLNKPLALYALLLLCIVSALVFATHGIAALIAWIAGWVRPWRIALMIDGISIGILYGFVLKTTFKRFVNVTPCFSFAHKFNEGPWLHLGGDARSSMIINWFTREPCMGMVEYGIAGKTMNIARDDAPGKAHHVQLDDLEPGTKYQYRIVDFPKDDSFHEFSTQPAKPTVFSFAVVGDTQNGGGKGTPNWGFLPIVNSILKHDISLFMHVGDATDQGNDLLSWHEFFEAANPVSSRVPMHIAVGNHDTGTRYMKDPDSKKIYPDEGANYDYVLGYNYHAPPDQDEITPFRSRYYSFYFNNCFIMMVDTQNSLMAGAKNPQWEYMREQLSKVPPGYFKLVFLHRDLIRIRPKEDGTFYHAFDQFAKFLLPILDEYKVDVVFQGHAHNYVNYTWKLSEDAPFEFDKSRANYHPITFFTCGGAGKELRRQEPFDNSKVNLPGFQLQSDSSHFLIVDISDHECVVTARYADDEPFHVRTISKRATNH